MARCGCLPAAAAVAAVGALPQLGFIHEDGGQSFVLDIADLGRHDVVLDIAFGAAREAERSDLSVDRLMRRRAAGTFRRQAVIPGLIDAIKVLLGPGPEG